MVINTNTSAQISANNLEQSQKMLSKSLARLSSGSKIVSPADDAAGLAVSSSMDAQVQRMDAANSNVGNAISFT
jgi:flagellin